MGRARLIAGMLFLILVPSSLFAVTPIEYAHAAIAIAQARIELGKQQPDMPDKPPQAESPILGDAEPLDPPDVQGLARDTGGTDAPGEQSVNKTVLDKVLDPMEASCVVRIAGSNKATFLGSGTVITSNDSGSDVLTCAHIGRDVPDPMASVDIGGKNYAAQTVKIDWEHDLALYHINEPLPSVVIADELPNAGAILTSIGLGSFKQSKMIGIDSLNVPACLVTDALEQEGRSGGGLFDHGKLIGVIKERNDAIRMSRYVALDEIKSFLKSPAPEKKKEPEPVQGSIPILDLPDEVLPSPVPYKPMRMIVQSTAAPVTPGRYVVTAYSGTNCRYCKEEHDKFGDGDDRILIDWTEEKLPGWIQKQLPRAATYPIYCYRIEATGAYSWFANSRGLTLDLLHKYCKQYGAEQEGSKGYPESGVAGAIQAGPQIQQMVDYLRQYIGEGNQSTFTWDRNGAELINLLSRTDWTCKALFGTNGRIQLDSPRAINLPVKTFSFDYLVRGSDVTLDAGPITIPGLADRMTISERPQLAGASPVGLIGIDDLLLADQIFNLMKDVISILWPTVDLQLPEQVLASAVLSGNVVTVTFDKGPSICIKMLFHFQLSVKSVTITLPTADRHGNVHLQFTGSRWIRSRDFSIQ